MKEIAELTGDVIMTNQSEFQDTLYFVLKKEDDTLIISFKDILLCLKFAESQGVTPEFPHGWWSRIHSAYPEIEDVDDLEES